VVPPTEPCALRSTQRLKVNTRDFSWGKGGRCVWLTTYHPCVPKRQENPGPEATRNPLGQLGLSRDTFTLLLIYIIYFMSLSFRASGFCRVKKSHKSYVGVIDTRVGTLIVATIYLQLIQNRYMFRSFTILQCSHQNCVQPVASDVEVVGYL